MAETERIDAAQAAAFLRGADNIRLLAHAAPDGDTLGANNALCLALRMLGKRADVACADDIPPRYAFLAVPPEPADFIPRVYVSVDVADAKLLGENEEMGRQAALCVDHHPSNRLYAARTLLDPEASSACEVVADVIDELGVEITPDIAARIYTGLATDTGCFRFGNTGAKALRLAARLLEAGAPAARINKRLFDTVSRQRLAAERLVLQGLEYYEDGRVALVVLSQAMRKETGIEEADMEGFASLTARIEGVIIGVTVRERDDGGYKLSLRTNGGVDASAICARFGGGGHKAAAGCRMPGPVEDVRRAILAAAREALEAYDRAARSE